MAVAFREHPLYHTQEGCSPPHLHLFLTNNPELICYISLQNYNQTVQVVHHDVQPT